MARFRFEVEFNVGSGLRERPVMRYTVCSALELLDRLLRARHWQWISGLRVIPTHRGVATTLPILGWVNPTETPGSDREKIEELAQRAWDAAMRRVGQANWDFDHPEVIRRAAELRARLGK